MSCSGAERFSEVINIIALEVGGDYIRKFGDQAKIKKHAPAVSNLRVTHFFLRPSRFFARGGRLSPKS